MKSWDLYTGAAKLKMGMEDLGKKRAVIQDVWNDEKHRAFEELYLDPLAERIKRALDGVLRLNEVLAKAERDCDDRE